MNQLSLQEIKQIEFELLKLFDSFCKKNNIKYFLSNGTLLGAVKYKGFIPWDDDIDVFVPREDYNKLLALFNDDSRYKLFSFERNPNYRFPFAKLCDMMTKKVEGNNNNGVDLGIDIDIFPLDSWNDHVNRAKKELRKIQKMMFFLGLSKRYQPDSLNPIKRGIKRVLMGYSKIFGSEYFVRKIIHLSSRNDCKAEGRLLGCKSWCIYGEREIIPADVFGQTIEVEFEGGVFPAPIGYDTYLRSLYGDYEMDPPKEAQKTHHSYIAYRI